MDDLISRQAAIDEILTWLKDCMTDGKNGKPLTDRIKDLPPAQPERKTGHWLIREGISDAQCSECGMYFNDVYDMENSDAFCRPAECN